MEWIEKYIEYWNKQDTEGIISLFCKSSYDYSDKPFEAGIAINDVLDQTPPEKDAQMQLRFHISEGSKHAARVLYYKTGAIEGKERRPGAYDVKWLDLLHSRIMLFELNSEGKCIYMYEMECPKEWCNEDDQDPYTRLDNIPNYF